MQCSIAGFSASENGLAKSVGFKWY
jgi:hypothetical protein